MSPSFSGISLCRIFLLQYWNLVAQTSGIDGSNPTATGEARPPISPASFTRTNNCCRLLESASQAIISIDRGGTDCSGQPARRRDVWIHRGRTAGRPRSSCCCPNRSGRRMAASGTNTSSGRGPPHGDRPRSLRAAQGRHGISRRSQPQHHRDRRRHLRHRLHQRYQPPQGAGSATDACAEDGSRGTPGRRRGARFQQHAHRDRGLQPDDPG